MLDAQSGSLTHRFSLNPKENPMVRESEMRQIEKATDRTTDPPDSATVRNAIEGNSLSPHQSDVDARHRRIAEAAYRIAEARGFATGSELDDWLAAERDVGAADQDRLTPRSKPAPAQPSYETSGSTTPGRPKETASRQQTRHDQNSQTGSAELDEAAARRGDASAAVPERLADAK
jgi:DUF2934 family protein